MRFHRAQRTSLLLLAGLLMTSALAGEASAGNVAAAARAYAEGQEAFLASDYDRAADRFELANTIEPSAEALRSAIRAHEKGGNLERAGMLAEQLLSRYPDDDISTALANDILTQVRARFGRVEIACTDDCTVVVARRALSMMPARRHAFFLPPGSQTVSISFGERAVLRRVTTTVGGSVSFEVRPPPTPKQPVALKAAPAIAQQPPVAPKRRGGLPRVVPLIGLTLTVASAGLATWSALDTSSAHTDYVREPEPAAWRDGRSRQLRTNTLWGITAGLGVVTLATAYWTNWHPTESLRVGLVPSADHVMVVLSSSL